MKINIGAGNSKYSDYVTIDNDKNKNPDYLLDLEKDPLPFEDNTVEHVIANHVLEHLGEGFFHCLQELYRVCKPGALISVTVPHPRHDSFLADPTHRRPITPMTFQLFSKKFNKLSVEKQWPSSTLGEYYDVDFEIIEHSYSLDQSFKERLQGASEAQIDQAAKEINNLIAEISIQLVVVK